MDDEVSRSVRRWIALEGAEPADDQEADAALGMIFQTIPRPEVPARFSDQVFEAIRRAPLPAGRRPLVRPWVKPARVAGAVAIGGLAAYAGIVVLLPLAAGAFVRLIGFLAEACLWLALGLDAGLDIWTPLTATGRAIVLAASTPQVSAGLVAMGLVGAAALYALQRVLSSEQESSQ